MHDSTSLNYGHLTGHFALTLGKEKVLCDQIMVRNHFW